MNCICNFYQLVWGLGEFELLDDDFATFGLFYLDLLYVPRVRVAVGNIRDAFRWP